MQPLHELSALELLAGFRSGEFKPSDALEAVFDRIAAFEPHLHALYAFDPEAARIEAAASDRRWKEGKPIGPLDGVPVSIKENIATAGVPVPLGTAATSLRPALVDAPPAARLREAGALIFAKTTMPDYGMLSSGLSSFHALTRNPWDLSKNPGGSSAGAGAAAAAGYGPLHIGTDIGGSVRLPACWCGIVALKPSLGRVPIDPPYLGRVAGPMTRSVGDAALMMQVLSAPDPRDSMSLPFEMIDWQASRKGCKGLRIGLLLDLGFGLELNDEVRAAIRAAADILREHGAVLIEIPTVLTRGMLDGMDHFWRARAFDDMSALPAESRAKILPFILRWAESGAQLSGVDVLRGFNATMAMRSAAAKSFETLDYIVSPVAPNLNFPAEWASPLNDPERPFEHIGYTLPWNMAEQPAISLNAGYSKNGFPIGVQIIGRRFDDLGVLQLARTFEASRPPQRRWPEPPSDGQAAE